MLTEISLFARLDRALLVVDDVSQGEVEAQGKLIEDDESSYVNYTLHHKKVMFTI